MRHSNTINFILQRRFLVSNNASISNLDISSFNRGKKNFQKRIFSNFLFSKLFILYFFSVLYLFSLHICVSKDNAFSELQLNKVYDRKLAEHIPEKGEDSKKTKTNFDINEDKKSQSIYGSPGMSELNKSVKHNHDGMSELKKKEILEESDRIEKKNDKVRDNMDKRKMNDEMGKQKIQNEGCAISLGNRSSELHYQLCESEINERIQNLDDVPSIEDIYILWWQVRGDQRNNFFQIIDYLKKLFKSLTNKYNFDESFLNKEYNKWYRGVLYEFINMEANDNKNFYSLYKRESWTREKFKDFIDRNILVWNNYKISIKNKWENILTEDFINEEQKRTDNSQQG
ncbi:Plasmodium exported protein (PHIST), unknown function [Plasmodium gallinaceum]|uniref:Plasmodium RESA N-terminal domain-containing protein n=1 Tax=Plasmodium gallinaceum TaxID=5849 RepID=A0A1J1GXV7_PLAGA|nr:Plasmodium exported protein (PHIST), unknown function [Plasmodium gallinaceum]CRG97396.1 Plasmodium exported protein (PHIST), unknown function [Plasmodium gallinaceum]